MKAWIKEILGITKIESDVAQLKLDMHGFKQDFEDLKKMIGHMNGNMENRNKLIMEMYNKVMDDDIGD